MDLYLIRHGQSENNARPETERVEDPPLTELGQRQAEHLARRLATMQIDRLMTSPFRRCLETTAPVAEVTGRVAEVHPELHEHGGCYRGFGAGPFEGAPGMTREEIEREFPGYEIDERIDLTGWWRCRPRETEAEAVLRARRMLDEAARRYASEHAVAWIIHAEFKRCLLSCLLGGEWRVPALGPVKNTGVTRLEWTGDRWLIQLINCAAHLPERIVTGAKG